jgi:glycosyltransferase involved in cell wall biosynthesis
VIEQLTRGFLKTPEVAAVGVLTTHFAFPRKCMDGLPATEVMDGGVVVHRVPGSPKLAPPYFSVPLVWFPPRAFRDVVRVFDPNILHWIGDGWFWGHIWSALSVSSETGIIFSPSFHRLTLDKQWLRLLNAVLCRRADRVTALSRLEADIVRPAYRVPRRKQVILPWGVEKGPTGDRGKKRSRKNGRLTVLCVGRLGRHKNQCFLIDVWAKARHRFKQRARLVLVGRDEAGTGGERDIRRLISTLGLEDDVEIAGEVEDTDLNNFYAESDLFALFSKYEAFGLVFFEAMKRGVPVLTHRVGANPELLKRGAVITEAFDARAAGQRLVELVNDDLYRRRLASEAEVYAGEFVWDKVIRRFIALYAEVFAERYAHHHVRTETGGDERRFG